MKKTTQICFKSKWPHSNIKLNDKPKITHCRLLYWLGTGTSIKRVKLVLWASSIPSWFEKLILLPAS